METDADVETKKIYLLPTQTNKSRRLERAGSSSSYAHKYLNERLLTMAKIIHRILLEQQKK